MAIEAGWPNAPQAKDARGPEAGRGNAVSPWISESESPNRGRTELGSIPELSTPLSPEWVPGCQAVINRSLPAALEQAKPACHNHSQGLMGPQTWTLAVASCPQPHCGWILHLALFSFLRPGLLSAPGPFSVLCLPCLGACHGWMFTMSED